MSRLGNIGGRLYRGEVSFDFVGRKRLWYTISGAIIVVALAALLIFGLNFSLEFKGGTQFQFSAPGATTSQVTQTAVAAGAPNPSVQTLQFGNITKFQIETSQLPTAKAFAVQDALAAKFGLAKSAVSYASIGPSWGQQISQKALQALIAFLIVIVIYLSLAFEWRMAAAALVALAHDIVITVGVYALTGFQVSPATVIGLLTILGYSLYDTVVVFDKVRENTAGLLATRRSTYSGAANLALNQTLVRSINTSLIALLPVLAILIVGSFVLGNGELKDLSLVLFVGMLSGTYSSICIATPVLADLKEREPEYRQLAKQITQRQGSGRYQAKAAAARDAEAVQDEVVTVPSASDSNGTAPGQAPSGATAGSAASTGTTRPASSGQRQQPRRGGSAQRRPAARKKRR
jgi:preprotein translocase subunit SecF